ncbi:MAG: prolipoprotein diacylglyceryl transferase [Bacillota bacterium]
MFPVIFRIGPVVFYSYGLMLSLAFLGAMVVATAEGKRRGLRAQSMADFFLAIIVLAVIFSRLVYVAVNWPEFAQTPWQVLNIREGGLAIHGGILGGLIAGWWFTRRERLPYLLVADVAAPAMALGTAIGRAGCFLNGCCYGVLTSGAWGARTRYALGLRHPTQLYELVLSLGLFAFLWSWRRRSGRPGRLFFMYAAGYAAIRFVVEIFREVEGYLGPVSYAQALSLVLLVAAASFLVLTKHKQSF